MRIRSIILLIAVVLSVYSAAAEISLSQPKSIYNLGDEIALTATIKSGKSAEGFLKMTLSCGNDSKDFYLAPFSINANEEKKVDSNLSLSKSFLGDAKGKCTILVSTPTGDALSQSFEITDRIELTLILNKLGFTAGEPMSVKGSLLKPDGKSFSGFVEIGIAGTDISMVKSVNANQFQFNISLPDNIHSGTYTLHARAYEKDKNGETSNQGIEEIAIAVAKIPQKIEIALDSQSVVPGGNISFKIFMYDQANDEVQGDVSIVIKDPENEEHWEKLVKTNELAAFFVEKNATPGYWKIEAVFQGISVKRLFYIENQEQAGFEIIGDMLYIRNLGNTPYRKAVQIAIGDEVEIKEMDLEIGEVRKFRLAAPDGTYKVSVTDGQETLTLDTISLTGNAIGVVSEKSSNIFIKYPLVWIFIIIVFGMFILMMFERFADRKFIAYNVPEKASVEVKKQWTAQGLTFAGVREAEHTSSIQGHKEEASLVAFKIKNMPSLAKDQLSALESYFNAVYEQKGVIYKTGDYLIVILTPSITKTFKNNAHAVNVAKSISSHLHDHNKKFSRKIQYGIGLNYGSIIVEPLKDRLKFSSTGNALSLAKRIADISQGEILLSKDANTHIGSEIKTEKVPREGLDLYEIKKVTDRGTYDSFIQGFLHRNK